MELTRYVDDLQHRLATAAEAGGDEARQLASRLAAPLDAAVRLVLLDATGLPSRELNAMPASAWWRLNQTVERTGGRLVVVAPFPLVPCATLRLSLSAGLSLADFDSSREELVTRLNSTPTRLRNAT